MPATLAKAYYAAFNRKDWDEMVGLVAEDVVHFPNQGEPRSGRNALRTFVAESAAAYDERLTDFVYYPRAEGDGVAVEFTVNGVYLTSQDGYPEARSQRYILPAAAFLSARGGKLTRIATYYNLRDWVSQVSHGDPAAGI